MLIDLWKQNLFLLTQYYQWIQALPGRASKRQLVPTLIRPRVLKHNIAKSLKKETSTKSLSFVILTSLLTFIARSRLYHAHLWAEDGPIFLSDALRFNWHTIIQPYAGYYQILPHLLAQLLVLFPLDFFAYAMTASCVLIYSFVAVQFVGPGYRWIVESDFSRLLCCIIFCFVPGLQESLGNAANLHTLCFVYIGLLAWRHSAYPPTDVEILFVFLGAMSEGGLIVMLPAFFYKGYIGKKFSSAAQKRDYFCCLIIVFSTCAHMVATQSALPYVGDFDIQDLLDFPKKAVFFLFQRYALVPIGGSELANDLYRQGDLSFSSIGFLMTVVVCYGLWKRQSTEKISLFLVPLCVLNVYFLTWIVRPGSCVTMFQNSESAPRYWLASSFFGPILWMAAIQGLGKYRHFLIPSYALFAIFQLAHQQVKLTSYKEHDWENSIRMLRSEIKNGAKEIAIPTNPEGWVFVYDVKNK